MRLLQCDEDGGFRLTEDLAEDDLPSYAILSHRWLAATDEPTFEDLSHNGAQAKLGYQKLLFWSTGQSYRGRSTPCFAGTAMRLPAMFVCPTSPDSRLTGPRGAFFSQAHGSPVALQELLASRSVPFYSGDGERLGDKRSLEQHIHEVTAIPQAALRGRPLHRFSVDERLSWMSARETTLEEDKAYSLVGMFDMYRAPVYGEGFAQAHKRLLELVHKLDNCVKDLRLSNPYDDKKRIEHTKGGLLVDAYD
ncbi:hypothetical protein LTR49_025552 [Elasticomyces elasticus]|nr:hypothetical protein LTR49_025552 [Elasticomyces elasticus]